MVSATRDAASGSSKCELTKSPTKRRALVIIGTLGRNESTTLLDGGGVMAKRGFSF
jgi:hypothetical protein